MLKKVTTAQIRRGRFDQDSRCYSQKQNNEKPRRLQPRNRKRAGSCATIRAHYRHPRSREHSRAGKTLYDTKTKAEQTTNENGANNQTDSNLPAGRGVVSMPIRHDDRRLSPPRHRAFAHPRCCCQHSHFSEGTLRSLRDAERRHNAARKNRGGRTQDEERNKRDSPDYRTTYARVLRLHLANTRRGQEPRKHRKRSVDVQKSGT